MMPIKATKVKSVSTCDHCCNCRRFDMFRYFLLIYGGFNSCGAPLFAAPFSTSRKAAPLLSSALHLKVENIEIRDLSRHIKTPWVWCRPFCRSPRTFMASSWLSKFVRSLEVYPDALERSWKILKADDSMIVCSTKALLVWTLASLSLRTPCSGEACHALPSWGPPYEPWEMPRKEMVRSKTLQKWKQQNHAKSPMTLHFGQAHGYTKPNSVRIRSELLGFWLKPFGEAHSLQSFQGKVQCGRIP